MITSSKKKTNTFFVADLVDYDYRFDDHDFLAFPIVQTNLNNPETEMGCYWVDIFGRLHTDNVIVKNIKEIGKDISFDDIDFDLMHW